VKVWVLVLKLVWHVLQGRGGDNVYVRLDGLSDAAAYEQDRKNFVLDSFSWSEAQDAFVMLQASVEPVDLAELERLYVSEVTL